MRTLPARHVHEMTDGDVLANLLFTTPGPSHSLQGSATPREQWPEDDALRKEILANRSEPYGDRMQQLVFIGIDLDQHAIRAALDRCLLTDREMKGGPKSGRR